MDFGATLAKAEKLLELDGIKVSIEDGAADPDRAGSVASRRPAGRDAYSSYASGVTLLGELIQIDGSPHDWFEGRAPRCTLIVFIDDATGQLTALQFRTDEVESGAGISGCLA